MHLVIRSVQEADLIVLKTKIQVLICSNVIGSNAIFAFIFALGIIIF